MEELKVQYELLRSHMWRQTGDKQFALDYFTNLKKLQKLVDDYTTTLPREDHNRILYGAIGHDLYSTMYSLVHFAKNNYDRYGTFHDELIRHADKFLSFVHNIVEGRVNKYGHNLYRGSGYIGTPENPLWESKYYVNSRGTAERAYNEKEIEIIRDAQQRTLAKYPNDDWAIKRVKWANELVPYKEDDNG